MLEKTISGGPTTKLEPLETVEEGDRVAVHRRLLTIREGEPVVFVMMAMYRFAAVVSRRTGACPSRGLVLKIIVIC